MNGFREILVNGRWILRVDLSGIGTGAREDYLPVFAEVKKLIATKPLNSVLSLTKVNNYKLTDEVQTDIKDLLKHNRPYVKKGAVIGVTGLAKVMLNSFSRILHRNMMCFDDEEEAIAWLTQKGKERKAV